MNSTPSALPGGNSPNAFTQLLNTLLQPRSTNRDEAFRERTIRITITIVALVSFFGVFISTVVFRDPWNPISLQTIQIVSVILSLIAGFLISRQQITWAGAILVLTFLVDAALIIPQPTIPNASSLALPIFMIAILTAGLVLPRSTIIPLGLATPFLMTFVLILTEPYNPNNISQLWIGVFIFVVEALFLRQLRVEFDSRLGAMRSSILEAEVARKEADQANQAKSQFLANMSHELRTPLNAIIGYTEIMLNGMAGTFTDKQTQLQNYINTNAKRLLGLINDILDLAKIESGTIQLTNTLASPRQVVSETVESMQSLAQQKNIKLEVTTDESLPEATLFDVKKFQQIVTNLVANAIKFTEQGTVNVQLGAQDAQKWQMKVSDTGRGIPKEALGFIFESFRQVDPSDAREQKGTGLGLAIIKGLVERMGGTITATSEVGKGSTFIVTLPRVNVPEVAAAAEPASAASPAASKPATQTTQPASS